MVKFSSKERREIIKKEVMEEPHKINLFRGTVKKHYREKFECSRSVVERDINHLKKNVEGFEEKLNAVKKISSKERENQIKNLFDSKTDFDQYELANKWGVHRSMVERSVYKVINKHNLWENLNKLSCYKSQVIQRHVNKEKIRSIVKTKPEVEGSKIQYLIQETGYGDKSTPYDLINELIEEDKDFEKKWSEWNKKRFEERREKIANQIEKGKITPKKIQENFSITPAQYQKDKQKIINEHPEKESVFEENVKHRLILDKEENKKKFYDHLTKYKIPKSRNPKNTADLIHNHPAYGKNLIEFYENYLGVRYGAVYSYVDELLKDRKFREVYFALQKNSFESNKKKLKWFIENNPKKLLKDHIPDFHMMHGVKLSSLIKKLGEIDNNKISAIVEATNHNYKNKEVNFEKVFSLYQEHRIEPILTAVVARALGINLAIDRNLLSNIKNNGFRDKYERQKWS